MKNNKTNKKSNIIKLCPECGGKHFKHDYIHEETYCAECGLILIAPPECHRIFPGFLFLNLKKLKGDKRT